MWSYFRPISCIHVFQSYDTYHWLQSWDPFEISVISVGGNSDCMFACHSFSTSPRH